MKIEDIKNSAHNSFMYGLPWIAALIGFICIVIAYLIFPDTSSGRGIFSDVGIAILVGGVFSGMLKSFQFMGIYRKDLSDLIYADRFLSIRKDIEDVWCKITSNIYKGKFPDLSPHLQKTITKQYLPTNQPYYYRKYNRVVRVDWHDREKSIVTVIDQLETEIVPCERGETINYKFWSDYETEEGENATVQELEKLTIDGIHYENSYEKKEYTDSNDVKKVKHQYNIELTGKDKYKVHRRMKRQFSLNVDPYSRYLTDTFIHGSTVKVTVVPPDLRVDFISLGTPEDYSESGLGGKHADKWRAIDKRLEGLLFPRQGYVLYYQSTIQTNLN